MEREQESSRNETRPFILRYLVENYEENLGRSANTPSLSNTSIRLDRNQLVNFLLTRARNSSDSSAELSVLERRIRRRRFTLLDEEGESQDELNNPIEEEEYLDFRTYPLTINWKDVFSAENDLYEILEIYGYIGAYFYNEIFLRFKEFKTKPETFLLNLIEFYHKNFQIADFEALRNIQIFVDVFLSKIDVLRRIICLGNVKKKEIALLKIIFDILIHYFTEVERFKTKDLLDKIIPIYLLFFSMLSNKDIKYMDGVLNTNKIGKDVIDKLNAISTDKKTKYLKHLMKIKNQFTLLFRGIEHNKFVI